MKQIIVLILTTMSCGLMAEAQHTQPYGLVGKSLSTPVFVDIDNDGDLDAFGASVTKPKGVVTFWQNTGSPDQPEFGNLKKQPFGLKGKVNSAPQFADMDNDGDLDALGAKPESSSIVYWENTGDKGNPRFQTFGKQPFNLTDKTLTAPVLADLDNDGDVDLVGVSKKRELFYRENTGSESNPQFGPKKVKPFHMTQKVNSSPTFVDFDNDRDLDAFSSKSGIVGYWENKGSESNPDFRQFQKNAFDMERRSLTAPAVVDIVGNERLEVIGIMTGSNKGKIFRYRFGP